MLQEQNFEWHHDWDPESQEPEVEDRERDPVVDEAKRSLVQFFDEKSGEVFYQRQLMVMFEQKFFHWITARALSELVEEGRILSDEEFLPPKGKIVFYRARSHRYWRRQAKEIVELVMRFSDESFTDGLGAQGELMFEAALGSAGFRALGRKVRSYGGKNWTATGHDLDCVFDRDGIEYGAEIKNTLPYIPRNELGVKLVMCKVLGLRPLFIVRMAPKTYINEVRLEGGFTQVFQYQLYPFGQKRFADSVRDRLHIPVDSPVRIADGTVQRFLNWHMRQLGSAQE